jgi:hypothetical protein
MHLKVKRVTQSRKENAEINPNSNLAKLRRAREDRDETKHLLPKPQENPGWMSRFGWLGRLKPSEFSSGESTVDKSDEGMT